ncbi:MAG: protein kinase [Planctomycetota bacterium]|nr:protein kinase [Planctomycetota bacterium]
MTDSVGNRFGEIVVREGFAAKTAVQECLGIQEKLRSFGVEPKRIGEIMVEKGYLTDGDVAEILEIQTGKTGKVDLKSAAKSPSPTGHPEDEFTPPKELAGYEIGELLGRGGMGAVYKARQTSLDRTVAIKILPPRTAKNRSFIQRFISEARTVARLNHKNIIAGIDVGEDKGFYYFVMEFVEGQSLDKIIDDRGVMDESDAIEVMVQISRALDHAAKNNLVHRDVKPQNILIDSTGHAKLCDLGLAQTMTTLNGSQSKSGETRNAPLGTPHYLSPEQARGEADLDIRSDLYSLGATFFHMVTGRPPFEGQSPMVLMTKHLTEDPEDPKKINSNISKSCSNLILALLEKDRADRPQTPEGLLEDLERVKTGKKPKVGTKGSRRQRKADKKVSGSSSTSSRKRRSEGGRGPAHDDSKRRRRAATIREVKKNENTFLIIFIVTVITLIGLFLFIILKPNTTFRDTKGPAEESIQQEALDLLEQGRTAQNQGDVDSARAIYKQILKDYSNTRAASNADRALDTLK